FCWLWQQAIKKFNTVFIIALLALSGYGFLNLRQEKITRINAYKTSPAMAAGNWIAQNYNHNVYVLADKYSYIPPINNVQAETTFQLDTTLINSRKPDLIIINQKIWSRYLSKNSNNFLNGLEAYESRRVMYITMMENQFKGYRLVKDFGAVKVLERE